jgi:hypothetical protein
MSAACAAVRLDAAMHAAASERKIVRGRRVGMRCLHVLFEIEALQILGAKLLLF